MSKKILLSEFVCLSIKGQNDEEFNEFKDIVCNEYEISDSVLYFNFNQNGYSRTLTLIVQSDIVKVLKVKGHSEGSYEYEDITNEIKGLFF